MFYEHIKEKSQQRATKYDRLENEEQTIGDTVEPNGKTVYEKLRSFVFLSTVVFIITTIYVCLINLYVVYLNNRVEALELALANLEKDHEIRNKVHMIRVPDCVVRGTCQFAATNPKYRVFIPKVNLDV